MEEVKPEKEYITMRILALDFASATGWAVGGVSTDGQESIYAHGTKVFTGDRKSRARQFLLWLSAMLADEVPDVIVYERPFARGRDATRCQWGLAGIVEAVGSGTSAVLDVEVQTLKEFVTGKGGATKEQMMEGVRKRLELTKFNGTDHEADALGLFLYAATNCEVDYDG